MLPRWSSVILVVLTATLSAQAQVNSGLIPEPTAERHGLTRPWWGQIQIDPAKSRVTSVSLHYGTILAVTDQGTVQAFDAENGKLLWTQRVGKASYPTLAAAANSIICAVVNGSTLYMYELDSGRFYDKRDVPGVPSGPPAVSRDSVYVPTQHGLVEVHKIVDDGRPAVTYPAIGGARYAPYITKESVVYPTEQGNVYALSTQGGHRFTMTAFKGVSAPVTYSPPYVYCSSVGGYLYAVHEVNGRVIWRFSAGLPIRQMPVVVKDVVYVTPETGGLYRLKTALGQEEWFAPGIKRFLAASAKRVYALDVAGRIVVLDAATGGRIDTLPITGNALTMTNYQNDRLYLVNDTGLIQCLHEADANEPINHLWETHKRVAIAEGQKIDLLVKPPAKDDKGAKKGDKAPAGEKPAEPAPGPAAPGPAAPGADPFAPGAGGPATPAPGTPAPGADPFAPGAGGAMPAPPAPGPATPAPDPFGNK